MPARCLQFLNAIPEDDSLQRGGTQQLRSYLDTLAECGQIVLTLDGVTPEMTGKLRKLIQNAWLQNPNESLELAMTFMRDAVMHQGAGSSFEWLTIYSILVAKVPDYNPFCADAYAQLAQEARTLAARADAQEIDPSGMQGMADDADRALLEKFPATPQTLHACADLLISYQSSGRTAEIDKLMQWATGEQATTAVLAWAGDYFYQLGTRDSSTRAVDSYTRLIKAAPDNASAADWQYRLAASLEGSGKTPEAVTAYTTVVTKYPNSAAAALAALKLKGLKGA